MFQLLKRQVALLLATLVVASCIGCKGIYSDNVHSENAFRKDATFDWVGTVRQKDSNTETFGYSSKAKQIEQHLLGENDK